MLRCMEQFRWPVSANSDLWGEAESVKEYFELDHVSDDWVVRGNIKEIPDGSRIWVRESLPAQKIWATGITVGPIYQSGEYRRVAIEWDRIATRAIVAADGIPSPAYSQTPVHLPDDEAAELEEWLAGEADTEPNPTIKRALRSVAQRVGQQVFRQKLMGTYGGRCQVTGCDVAEALEAAHIDPYDGTNSTVANGLLLRADIHALFDAHRLWVEANSTVGMAKALSRHYGHLARVALAGSVTGAAAPDAAALARHRDRRSGRP